MTEAVQEHETTLQVGDDYAAGTSAGTDKEFSVSAACVHHCDLRGSLVRLFDETGAMVKETELVTFDGAANHTADSVVRAPVKPGEYTWTVVFVGSEKQGVGHASSSQHTFNVQPHGTSIHIAEVPDPLVMDGLFKVRVGVRCDEGCNLAGQTIAVYDHEGVQLATATLGDIPWATAEAECGAEVELKAPEIETRYVWEVKFPEPDLEIPHEGSACTFAFGVAAQPEHVVSVLVLDADTGAPVTQVSIILRPTLYRGSDYSGHADEMGMASVRVPKGEYHISAVSGGYKSLVQVAEVAGDLAVTALLRGGSDLDDMFGL